ncbi:hypothetical protein ACMD2_08161, partial [Ananas comosus]
ATEELIREIALLELEVMHLEQYLLSLYRKAFSQQISTLSPTNKDTSEQPLTARSGQCQETTENANSSKRESPPILSSSRQILKKPTDPPTKHSPVICQETQQEGARVQRSHSSVSQRAACSARISPSQESLKRALHSFYSQPLSFPKEGENSNSRAVSLADHLGKNIDDHIPDTPSRISEDMVRCMAAAYYKLADTPLDRNGPLSSPTSSFSSINAFSPQYIGDMWSPMRKKESILDTWMINAFGIEGLRELTGPYNAMLEVTSISRDRGKLTDVEDLLKNYKSMVRRLETVDPRKMKNDEKLAFWINIHNALLMHAHLEYGIPPNNLKKMSMLVKATCIVGGRSINVATIQGLILGCHTHCPGQWLRLLLHARMKNKAGNKLGDYAIEQYEPLLHFALCSGSHSDPAVRVYTPKRLAQQLETAKEEFVRATVGIWKEQKILLPKLIESYAKDIKLTSQGLIQMVHRYLPENLRTAVYKCQQGRSNQIVEWAPYNFNFRYLLPRELTFPHTN